MPDLVKSLFEIDEVVEELYTVLQVLFNQNAFVEDMFVLLPGLKPAFSSTRQLLSNRIEAILYQTLLGWLISDMAMWFWHSLLLPFLKRGMTSDYVHSLGHS